MSMQPTFKAPPHTGVTLHVSHDFAASPERVFDAWLDPETARTWLFATPAGIMKQVAIDPRVGGRFTITEQREGEEIAHTGTYEVIDRPRRLIFSFMVAKYSSVMTKVSVVILPAPRGSILTLTHEGVLADYAERTQQGWAKTLDQLAIILANPI